MHLRHYGSSGPLVLVLHGGPGAAGSAAPIARALSGLFRVWEPFQRGSGGEPLTVAGHIADLRELIGDARPALVGHSWGAMLALAFAAAHPESAGPLALIGCGTFDPESRAVFQARFRQAPPENDPEPCEFDARAHQETWDDMLRQQALGTYPADFTAIRSPVLMLHGAADPHPGRMIAERLRAHLPRLEYREFEGCGHYPWLSASVREPFFAELRRWLAGHGVC